MPEIDWSQATTFPAILTKNNTNAPGGRKVVFDTPETADKIVASLCGTENKVNYLVAVLPLDAVAQPGKRGPGRPTKSEAS